MRTSTRLLQAALSLCVLTASSLASAQASVGNNSTTTVGFFVTPNTVPTGSSSVNVLFTFAVQTPPGLAFNGGEALKATPTLGMGAITAIGPITLDTHGTATTMTASDFTAAFTAAAAGVEQSVTVTCGTLSATGLLGVGDSLSLEVTIDTSSVSQGSASVRFSNTFATVDGSTTDAPLVSDGWTSMGVVGFPAGPAGAVGATGPTGAAGSNGVNGAAGAIGPTGPAGSPGLQYKGAYSALASYAIGDVVTGPSGSSYVNISGANAGPPLTDTTDWALLAEAGAAGATGAAGAAGAAGMNGAAGAAGAAGAEGATGPAGAPGANGTAGAAGPAGAAGTLGPTGPTGPAGSGCNTAPGATNTAMLSAMMALVPMYLRRKRRSML